MYQAARPLLSSTEQFRGERSMNRPYLVDAAERIVASFVLAFATAVIGVGTLDLRAVKAGAIAGVFMVLQIGKVVAARFVGEPDSAGLAPRAEANASIDTAPAASFPAEGALSRLEAAYLAR